MSRFALSFLTVCVALGSGGCGHYSKLDLYFDDSAKIQKGVTTRGEVEDRFGLPNRLSTNNGVSLAEYTSWRTELGDPAGQVNIKKILRVTYRNNIVQDFWRSETAKCYPNSGFFNPHVDKEEGNTPATAPASQPK